jgi:SAM-dependent methyltransferase
MSAPMIEFALSLIEPQLKPESRILDLGSGDGHMTPLFDQSGIRCTVGIEINPEMVRPALRKYPASNFIVGNVEQLPFPDAAFDLIYSNTLMQFTERATVLAECARVLRPGGSLICIENMKGSPVARVLRAYARHVKFEYPIYCAPKDHLSWENRSVYETCFTDVGYKSFNLLTTGIFVLMGQLPQTPFVLRASERLLSAFHRVDRYLLDSVPLLSRYNWHCVIYGTKR